MFYIPNIFRIYSQRIAEVSALSLEFLKETNACLNHTSSKLSNHRLVYPMRTIVHIVVNCSRIVSYSYQIHCVILLYIYFALSATSHLGASFSIPQATWNAFNATISGHLYNGELLLASLMSMMPHLKSRAQRLNIIARKIDVELAPPQISEFRAYINSTMWVDRLDSIYIRTPGSEVFSHYVLGI